MDIVFTTTITHTVHIGEEGIEGADHAVAVDVPEGLPEAVARAAALGGCRSAVQALGG
jgi:hypothetical protein